MALFALSERNQEKAANLFETYSKKFYDRALYYARNKDEAHDLVQTAMLELIKQLDRGTGRACALEDGPLSDYVLGIIRNVYRNKCKKAGRELKKLEKLEIVLLRGGDVDDDSPEQRLVKREEMHLVERAALRLPEHGRLYLQMKFVYHFDNAGIAEALDIKPGSVPMLRKRTLEQLRRYIREEEEQEQGQEECRA